jgi:hypothetical protein
MNSTDHKERKKVMKELKEAIEKEFGFDVHIIGLEEKK